MTLPSTTEIMDRDVAPVPISIPMGSLDAVAKALILGEVVSDAQARRTAGWPLAAKLIDDGVEVVDGRERALMRAFLAESRDSWLVQVWKLPRRSGEHDSRERVSSDIGLVTLACYAHCADRSPDWQGSLSREERINDIGLCDLDVIMNAIGEVRQLPRV